jgi:hypothetical protein
MSTADELWQAAVGRAGSGPIQSWPSGSNPETADHIGIQRLERRNVLKHMADSGFVSPDRSNQRSSKRMSATRPVVIQSYSSDQIQAHLYESFIHGRTADVSLIVEGDAWHATYSLHRVVLIQAGFFQSLFTSGFSEMHARSTSPSRGMDGADIIEVQFDDPNITRAGESIGAFSVRIEIDNLNAIIQLSSEPHLRFPSRSNAHNSCRICIARLYGGGPSLSVSPGFQSTPAHPLTPSFPSPPPPDPAPPNHHPATPRFLLSLLATATYLSIPSVSALALSLLLSSIGPYTVVRYLNFAIGKGIGPPDDNEPPCAVGLEHIGKEEASTSSGSSVRSNNDAAPDSPINGAARKMSAMTVRSSSTSSTDEGEGDGDQETYRDNTGDDSGPMFYYGAVSDKIGESCACWLARWGTDILPLEETYAGIALDVPETTSTLTHSQSTPIPTTSTSSSFIIVAPIASSAAARRATLPSSLSAPEPHLLRTTHSFVPPTLWNVGGLTPIWVRGVISSDVFFVKGNPLELSRRGPSSEWERYKFATRVVELRRCSGGGEGEETEWEKLFENGIYYSHMVMVSLIALVVCLTDVFLTQTFEDLLLMGQDISPSTKKPYVPLHVLQSAHWNQSIFRSQIMASRSSSASNHPLSRSNSPSPTPASTANDLGMVLNTSDVTMSTSDIVSGEAPKTFFPVPGDSSVRIGDSSSAPTEPGASPRGGKVHRNPADESNFFGIGGSRKTVKGVMDDDPTGKGKWCKNEPFRCGVPVRPRQKVAC